MPEFMMLNPTKIEFGPNTRTEGLPNVAALVASIRQIGLLQPMLVTDLGKDSYVLRAGHRRLAACKELSAEDPNAEFPCFVFAEEDGDTLTQNVTENFQRADLTVVEQAFACQALHENGASIDEISSVTGLRTGLVRLRLNIASLDPDIIEALRDNKVSIDAALAISMASDRAVQQYLLKNHLEHPTFWNASTIRSHATRMMFRVSNALFDAKRSDLEIYGADLFSDGQNSYFVDTDAAVEKQIAALKRKLKKDFPDFAGPIEVILSSKMNDTHERFVEVESPDSPVYNHNQDAASEEIAKELWEKRQLIGYVYPQGTHGFGFFADTTGISFFEEEEEDAELATSPASEKTSETGDAGKLDYTVRQSNAIRAWMTLATQARVTDLSVDNQLNFMLCLMMARPELHALFAPNVTMDRIGIYASGFNPGHGTVAHRDAESRAVIEKIIRERAPLIETIDDYSTWEQVTKLTYDEKIQMLIAMFIAALPELPSRAAVLPDFNPKDFDHAAWFGMANKHQLLAWAKNEFNKELDSKAKKSELANTLANIAREQDWLPPFLRDRKSTQNLSEAA